MCASTRPKSQRGRRPTAAQPEDRIIEGDTAGVGGVPVDGSEPRPGLLLEWRRAGHLWEGRVVYVAQLRPGRWATVEEWVPAELLSTE